MIGRSRWSPAVELGVLGLQLGAGVFFAAVRSGQCRIGRRLLQRDVPRSAGDGL